MLIELEVQKELSIRLVCSLSKRLEQVKRTFQYAYLLLFCIGCKGAHFKTRTGCWKAKTLYISYLILNLNNFKRR